MRISIFIVVIIFSSISQAKEFNNGCGSGWNEPLVPDKIITLGIDFRAACAAHDNCYSKCLEGGENYGKYICQQSATEKKEGRRNICDNEFLNNSVFSCEYNDPKLRKICEGVAVIYHLAIRVAGKGSFNGLEIPNEYYEFIQSEGAKEFNFSSFEMDINDVRQTKDIEKSNRIKLNVRDGAPVADFISISAIKKNHESNIQGLHPVDVIKYGSVDLGQASNGTTPLKLDNLNIKALDINKLKMERSFSKNQ